MTGDSSSAVQSVVVRLLSLPLAHSLAASHDRQPDDTRQLVVLQLVDSNGSSGWGECSALNQPSYTAEWAEGAFAVLSAANPSPMAHPMAAAAVEMARLDLELKAKEQSLADHLQSDGTALVPAGAVVGMLPVPALMEAIDALINEGYGRIKVKIAPGHDVAPVQAIVGQYPELDLQVDANGSYVAEDVAIFRQLLDLGVRVIEQPFAIVDLAVAAELQRDERATVVADEAVTNIEDAERLLAASALGGVAIKPPRLGGLAAAVAMHDWCVAHGVEAAAGGMLESGLGRHALAAVAAMPGFTITGDLSPARRWLAEDPFADIVQDGAGIVIPRSPGVGPEPDLDVLERCTVRQVVRPR